MLILASHSFYENAVSMKINTLLPDQSGKMLIIGLAMESPTASDRIMREVNSVTMLDFQRKNVFVFDEQSPEISLQQDYQYIVVMGGNTFKLLMLTRKYGLDTFITSQVENGAVYIGFSAGAYLACPDIAHVASLDPNNYVTDGNYSGLGLTKEYVLCHYLEDERHNEERLREFQQVLGADAVVHTIMKDQVFVFQDSQESLK